MTDTPKTQFRGYAFVVRDERTGRVVQRTSSPRVAHRWAAAGRDRSVQCVDAAAYAAYRRHIGWTFDPPKEDTMTRTDTTRTPTSRPTDAELAHLLRTTADRYEILASGGVRNLAASPFTAHLRAVADALEAADAKGERL